MGEGGDEVLSVIAASFALIPADPYEKVKTLQAAFDPSALRVPAGYYDVLGLEIPEEHRL